MAVKNFPTDILAQTKDVLTACQQIDPDMKTGALTQAAFADELSQTQAIQSQIQALELQLIGLRNKRDERLAGMWDTVKRVRATVKGTYGDDSSEYELVGGTRMSAGGQCGGRRCRLRPSSSGVQQSGGDSGSRRRFPIRQAR